MKKLLVKKNERFYSFSVVLNPSGGQSVDWTKLSLDDSSYYNKMLELDFITPLSLSKLLYNYEGISQNSKDPKNIRRYKIVKFIGQLEKGSENKKPHYNLIITVDVKILSSALVKGLSQLLSNKNICNSISVEPAHVSSCLTSYCTKEDTRLLLEGTPYYPPAVDYRVSSFLEALHENKDLSKYPAIQDYFKK